jgi:hypothetical protein
LLNLRIASVIATTKETMSAHTSSASSPMSAPRRMIPPGQPHGMRQVLDLGDAPGQGRHRVEREHGPGSGRMKLVNCMARDWACAAVEMIRRSVRPAAMRASVASGGPVTASDELQAPDSETAVGASRDRHNFFLAEPFISGCR